MIVSKWRILEEILRCKRRRRTMMITSSWSSYSCCSICCCCVTKNFVQCYTHPCDRSSHRTILPLAVPKNVILRHNTMRILQFVLCTWHLLHCVFSQSQDNYALRMAQQGMNHVPLQQGMKSHEQDSLGTTSLRKQMQMKLKAKRFLLLVFTWKTKYNT